MLALVTSPAIIPRFRFGSSADPALNPARLTDVIWNLHSILINPASTATEAKAAKKRMLLVLEETKDLSLPQMIVPPMVFSPELAEDEHDAAPPLDRNRVCGTCQRPVTPAFRSRPALAKRRRASATRTPQAKNFETGRDAAFPRAAGANLTAAR